MSTTAVNSSPQNGTEMTNERRGIHAAAVEAGSRYGLVLILIASLLAFSALAPNTFMTSSNFSSIASTYAITLVLALAVLPALLVGQFDFSVTGTFGVANAIVADLVLIRGVSIYLAVAVALGAGVIVGVVNGLAVVRFRVNSLIATLGTGTVLIGCANGIAASGTIVGREQIVDGERVIYGFPQWFLTLGQGEFLNVSVLFWLAMVGVVAMWLVLDRTATGRRLNATGGNVVAARLSGVKTDRATFGSFVACGLVAALAGVLVTAMLGSGQTNIAQSYLLPAYAGAYLGATTIKPGRVNAWGTFVGVYLVGVCVAGLQQLGVASWVQDVFNGAALVIAVGASSQLARLASRGTRARRVRPVAE